MKKIYIWVIACVMFLLINGLYYFIIYRPFSAWDMQEGKSVRVAWLVLRKPGFVVVVTPEVTLLDNNLIAVEEYAERSGLLTPGVYVWFLTNRTEGWVQFEDLQSGSNVRIQVYEDSDGNGEYFNYSLPRDLPMKTALGEFMQRELTVQ